MKLNKTPGGDGLTVEFYREFWEDLQDLVLESLNVGFEKGHLSYTQSKGIITLLYKKGDKEDIGNWRPITLLNVDYKLAAMVLANRLQKVLSLLIDEDQVGYIKGRNGSYNAKIIQDIIDYAKFEKVDGCLLFVDFYKAFDTLEWNFIDECLESYGFNEMFRKWVSVLYTQISNSVILNGCFTDTIFPTRGIRQGCPLSALLFILSIEVVSNKIRGDNYIKGICIGEQSKEIKIGQLADDMTLFVENIISGNKALDHIKDFGNCSGVTLNKDKTQTMWLGKEKPVNMICGIPWAENYVKALGIFFSKNESLSCELNWSKEKIDKIEKILNICKQRNLTYKGKVIILKTQILSKPVYTAQIIFLS